MPAKKMVKKTPSILKRQRQNVKRRELNASAKARVKTLVKKVRDAAEKNDLAAARIAMVEAERALNKAATAGVLKKGNSSRRVSRLGKLLGKIGK